MTHFLTNWGYFALVVITLLAAMGVPTGSELAIAFAGALASGKITHAPHLNLLLVIGLATLAELAGSYLGYGIGRVGARPLLRRITRVLRVTDRDLERTERLFARYGSPFVLFGRFVPLVRSFVGVAAGLGRMAIIPYTLFTTIAVAIWCTALAVLGNVLGRQWNHVAGAATSVGWSLLGLIVISGLGLGAIWVRRARSAKRALANVAPVPVAADAVRAHGDEPDATR
ncbi:MAG TPA: DedA family protein [Acidimicrobiales bacterium]